MGQRVCLAAVVQSQHLKPKIELLVGILVYDTGFPFQSGDSREPGFESRRPHHHSLIGTLHSARVRVKAYNILPG